MTYKWIPAALVGWRYNGGIFLDGSNQTHAAVGPQDELWQARDVNSPIRWSNNFVKPDTKPSGRGGACGMNS
jgi:hypothetical protein